MLEADEAAHRKQRHTAYSAPVAPGTRVMAATGPLWVTIHHDNQCVARHLRHCGHGHQIRPGTLSGCGGAQARSDGGLHAAGAMAANRPLAGVFRRDLAAFGRASRQQPWHARDDRVGARGVAHGLAGADRGGRAGAQSGRIGCGGDTARSGSPGSSGAPSAPDRARRGCARRCWTGSPTGRMSSRPDRTRSGSSAR